MSTDHENLRTTVKRIRDAIRLHRDQKGDDRCWLDDHQLWVVIDDGAELAKLPPFQEMMSRCRMFYVHRNAKEPDPIPADAISDPDRWDQDIERMTEDELHKEFSRLTQAIRAHRDIHDRSRTADDDRKLYAVLPERLPADFRLPLEGEFLGEERKPHAGCPSFWRSHASCARKEHDVHRWGPCE